MSCTLQTATLTKAELLNVYLYRTAERPKPPGIGLRVELQLHIATYGVRHPAF